MRRGGIYKPRVCFDRRARRVTHLYGATETEGPATLCFPAEWNALSDDERFARMARQGVAYPMVAAASVADPKPWCRSTRWRDGRRDHGAQ
jgi:hypothetical protein